MPLSDESQLCNMTRHPGIHFVYDEAVADLIKEPATTLRPEVLAILQAMKSDTSNSTEKNTS